MSVLRCHIQNDREGVLEIELSDDHAAAYANASSVGARREIIQKVVEEAEQDIDWTVSDLTAWDITVDGEGP